MQIVERHMVLAESYDSAGRVVRTKEIGPFSNKCNAESAAYGHGFNGGNWPIKTMWYITIDGVKGIAMPYSPCTEAIPSEHPIAAALSSVSPSEARAIIKALGAS